MASAASPNTRPQPAAPKANVKTVVFLVGAVLLCLHQMRISVSFNVTVHSDSPLAAAFQHGGPPAIQQQQQQQATTTVHEDNGTTSTTAIQERNAHSTTRNNKNATMNACLLVMDDTVKLTEWLAYHYTTLPLSHLIVAIDPHSIHEQKIRHVLELWRKRLEFLDIWTHDTWMTLEPHQGWPPAAYSKSGAFRLKMDRGNYTHRGLAHKRRQEHLAVQCMRRLKSLNPSWVLNMDTDEFLTFNYPHDDEDASWFLKVGTERRQQRYNRFTRKKRNNTRSTRQNLPKLGQTTIVDFLNSLEWSNTTKCFRVPGLQMSARESHLSQVERDVPQSIDARKLMTLRHRKHGPKNGIFTKSIIDVSQLDYDLIVQKQVRTIHTPNKAACGLKNGKAHGTDYIASIFRLNHYAGTYEAFLERENDARKHRNASFVKRDVEPTGENDDLRPWIQAFVQKVGPEEAKRLLAPLDDAYQGKDWGLVWDANGAPV